MKKNKKINIDMDDNWNCLDGKQVFGISVMQSKWNNIRDDCKMEKGKSLWKKHYPLFQCKWKREHVTEEQILCAIKNYGELLKDKNIELPIYGCLHEFLEKGVYRFLSIDEAKKRFTKKNRFSYEGV